MEILVSILTGVAAAGIVALFRFIWVHRGMMSLVIWSARHPRTKIRVSVAAICIFKLDSGYVLIGQSRRPDQLGPIGGAVDVYPEGLGALEKIGFEVEYPLTQRWGIKRTPLRGSIDVRNLLRFRRWLQREGGRESFRECVERELQEELEDSGLGPFDIPRFRHFRWARNVTEGPKFVEGKDVWQWRYMRVFEYELDPEFDKKFIDQIRSVSTSNAQIQVVSASEIRKGRSAAGTMIGNHSEFLLSKRSKRPEMSWKDTPPRLRHY